MINHGKFDTGNLFDQKWGAYNEEEYGKDNTAEKSNPNLNLSVNADSHNTVSFAETEENDIESPFEATYKHGHSTMIPLSKIQPSKLNEVRKIDPDRVRYIANSIRLIGLLEPIVVYKNKDGNYTVYGGHIRLEAIHLLYDETDSDDYKKVLSSVPCIEIEAPKNDIEEMEVQAALNMHRYSDDDRNSAIKNAKDMWDRRTPEQQKKLKNYYREKFINSIGPASDDEIKRKLANDFRPVDEYIRAATGFTLTNRSITKILGDSEEENGEDGASAEPEKKKESKKEKKELTVDSLYKKLDNLCKAVDKYNQAHDNSAEAVLIACHRVRDELDQIEP